MAKEMICAGFGGQGVLTAGMILINAGMELDKNVLFYPSYGSEMRGGTANCTVKISDGLIASPISKNPDILLTMNTPAIDKFEDQLKPGGLLLVNSSIVPEDRTYRDDIKVVKIPATDIAMEVNNPKGANLVMLGALAANSDLFTVDYLEKAIVSFFEKKGKGKFNEKNVACYRRGVEGK
ncbi:MAG TPA: 2-oxoacid:acceptor oxidoreductase family protein [Candidatus Blautia intestinigallinarum]|nr:2-oxoacid:acceptor oxidoreductase family protein [Candidatus Blautia intestinigallinarum]